MEIECGDKSHVLFIDAKQNITVVFFYWRSIYSNKNWVTSSESTELFARYQGGSEQ